ncbi:IS4 family transposase [Desulfonema magnum]|uniref:Transposase family protein, IS4-like n=1 Tax=Desulfonema magnum TaxID=45655 RepID=A0A975GS10_9BACT|nr:IS4 family transposase [Desulfonema magnum]QTA91544.1 Transposase family protein, IS4-like [Desulfonema magnum]
MEKNSENYQNPTVFDRLLEPVSPLAEEQARKLTPHHNEKFSFPEFFRLLIFYFVSGVSSMKLLISTCLKKNLLPPEPNLTGVPYSTFSDAFGRFPPDLFKAVFTALIASVSLQSVPELSSLGVLYCADGSLFPVLKSMHWAVYKKNCNAARLHLCFELNRMIAADILVGSGNSSERDALRRMLVAGATYIADRGYAAFDMFHDIAQAHAHFIIRVKSNLLYTCEESFAVRIPASVRFLFSQITDEAIRYDNDPHSHVWRLIRFEAGGDTFYILTDRHDLTTFQIIMLYAYRWQAELFSDS